MLISAFGSEMLAVFVFFPTERIVRAPVLPQNISIIIIILPKDDSAEVIPAETPEVLNAEKTSKIIEIKEAFSVIERRIVPNIPADKQEPKIK